MSNKTKTINLFMIITILIIAISTIVIIKRETIHSTIESVDTWIKQQSGTTATKGAKLGITIESDLEGMKIRRGQNIKFDVTIWNSGKETAKNVKFGFGSNANKSVGDIPANESVETTYVYTAGTNYYSRDEITVSAVAKADNVSAVRSGEVDFYIDDESKIILYNISKNLNENPKGIAYKGDKLKGKIMINTGVAIQTGNLSAEFKDNGSNRENPNDTLYKNLRINIRIPYGLTVSNVYYDNNSNGQGSASYDVRNRIITATITTLSAGSVNLPSINFDYKIDSVSGNFSYNASASVLKQYYYKSYDSWVDTYTRAETREYFSSPSVTYFVGQPKLEITQQTLTGSEFTEGVVGEGSIIVYQTKIKNVGNAAAANVVLEDILPAGVLYNKILYSFSEELVRSAADVTTVKENGVERQKITFNIGQLKKDETVTVQIVCKTGILKLQEENRDYKNTATVSAKVTPEVTSNEVKGEVIKDPLIITEERERLNDAEDLCAKYPEIQVIEKRNESGRDRPIIQILELDGKPVFVYCIEIQEELVMPQNRYGVNFSQYSKKYIDSYGDNGQTKSKAHGCASDVKKYLVNSTSYYRCVQDHYTESSEYVDYKGTYYKNLYDMGFVATFNDDGTVDNNNIDISIDAANTWQAIKQQAIWQSQLSDKAYPSSYLGTLYQEEAQKYVLNYAEQYQSFYEEIMDTEDGKKEGVKAESLIDYEKDRIEIDTDTSNENQVLHKIGPFKIDYVDGRAKDDPSYSFGGISDMYLLDKNGKRIDIVSIIKNGTSFKVDYNLEGGKTFFSRWDDAFSVNNTNYMDWWDWSKTYPRPQEEFYIEVNSSDYDNSLPANLELKIEFSYLKCTATFCKREGIVYYVDQDHKDTSHCCSDHGEDGPCGGCCYSCRKVPKTSEKPSQSGVFIFYPNREFIVEEFTIPIEFGIVPRMKLGGFVFLDTPEGKETKVNGIKTETDFNLANIEVSLYYADTEELVKLSTLKEENQKATEEEINNPDDYTRRTNPTLTDSSGYYEFRGVDISKKYYVKYTYNGQTYIPTDYMKDCNIDELTVSNSTYGQTTNWQQSSKATERETERKSYNEKFASIGSYPNNYKTSNSLGLNLASTQGYNEVFSLNVLSGITLGSDGNYKYNENKQLIDTYLTIFEDNGITKYGEGTELKDGLISKAIRNYVKNLDINGRTITGSYANLEHKYPTKNIIKDYIYRQQIVPILVKNGDTQDVAWKKLQYIEDCKISSYTKTASTEKVNDFVNYPYGDLFTTSIPQGTRYPNNSYKNGTYAGDTDSVYPNKTILGVIYNNIYPGQLFINLGLVNRNKFDVALQKDVYKATLKINGKTHVYEYNERDVITPEEKAELNRLEKKMGRNSEAYLAYKTALDSKYWEIQTRITDYNTYYGATYNRELYNSDFRFSGTDPLEIYVTYKITIRNQSQHLLSEIDEIVDYYDETYEIMPNKSWVMYKKNNNSSNEEVYVFDQEFYDIMATDDNKNSLTNTKYIGQNYKYSDKSGVASNVKYKPISSSINKLKTGEYAANTRSELNGYDTLYVDGLNNKRLETGESAYVYLTFKVKGEGSNLKIQNDKHNIVEINGYTSYYQDGIDLPNGYTVKDTKLYSGNKVIADPAYAGIIDYDSTPGNITNNSLKKENGIYEYNFEDDTDRARGIKIFVDNSLTRVISGVAWEDKRNKTVEDAVIGNGIRDDNELRIKDIYVELYELKLDNNGNTVDLDSDGNLDTKRKVASMKTGNNGEYSFSGFIPGDYIVRFTYGGQYNPYYNGQDYKTTTYQFGIEQNGRTDISSEEYPGHVGYTKYGKYDGNYEQNLSGTYGYDIYKADSNTNGNVSDAKDLWAYRNKVNKYSSNNYNGVIYELANTLDKNESGNQNLQMVAETGVIRAEVEYNRQHSESNGLDNNDYGGTYTGEEYYTGNNNEFNNNLNGTYHIQNVDLGLEERPKAQLEINKKVSNVKIVLANKNVLFDATQTATNLIWQAKQAYNINSLKSSTENITRPEIKTNIYSDYNKYDEFREYVKNTIKSKLQYNSGIIQATMDEELMHGATIEITYDFSVTNISEVDYKETQFYYTGTIADEKTIVRTSADLVIDYVANNLQFSEKKNEKWNWKVISEKDITEKGYVNSEVAKTLKNFNSIIITDKLTNNSKGTRLIPLTASTKDNTETHSDIKLVLTQTITAENDNDDLTYGNLAEIVKISNDVGRRMAFSVQGNQDPTKPDSITEPDTSKAERVVILPPFGSEYVYYGLAALVMALLAIGIIIIKKVVLPKNK